MNKRIIYVVKDKDTNTLLPLAGVWIAKDDPEIAKFIKSNPDCIIVECELTELIKNND